MRFAGKLPHTSYLRMYARAHTAASCRHHGREGDPRLRDSDAAHRKRMPAALHSPGSPLRFDVSLQLFNTHLYIQYANLWCVQTTRILNDTGGDARGRNCACCAAPPGGMLNLSVLASHISYAPAPPRLARAVPYLSAASRGEGRRQSRARLQVQRRTRGAQKQRAREWQR